MLSAQEQKEQINQDLDELIVSTDKTKQQSQEINQELREQQVMIDETDNHMDRTHEKVNEALLTTKDIQNHKTTCLAWILCLVFFILIFVVAFAWKK